jgi:cytochrome c oxidase subunit 2
LRGRQLFNEVGCAACHRVADTDAQGISGPDLTHVGSRRSLGAGILPNTRATLIGWIGDSQSIKPNNRMPAYRSLKADELNALASYMESLK